MFDCKVLCAVKTMTVYNKTLTFLYEVDVFVTKLPAVVAIRSRALTVANVRNQLEEPDVRAAR